MISAIRSSGTRKVVCRMAAALLSLALLAAGGSEAAAKRLACGEHEKVLQQLHERFAEVRSGYGVTSEGQLLELVIGPQGSWSLLITLPGGPTCLVASGEGWRKIVQPVEEPLA